MSHFTADFLAFFKELAANNSKKWFDANRERYERSIKRPFEAFIGEMIARISADDPNVAITPKDAILRINRDIRFAKDKTPYNDYMAAIISAGGRKDKSIPGLYLRLGADEIRIYGGAHMVDANALERIRKAIATDLNGFEKLLKAPDFRTRFGTLHGEQHKRLPATFTAIAERQPLIANKQFYYYAILDANHLLSDDLPDLVMSYYRAGKPINTFLRRAMGV